MNNMTEIWQSFTEFYIDLMLFNYNIACYLES